MQSENVNNNKKIKVKIKNQNNKNKNVKFIEIKHHYLDLLQYLSYKLGQAKIMQLFLRKTMLMRKLLVDNMLENSQLSLDPLF